MDPEHRSAVAKLTPARLECLVALVDRGSYRAAAEELGRTTVAVRQNIAELQEATGGAPLVVKDPDDQLVATERGRAVLETAREVLGRCRRLVDDGAEQQTVVAFLPHHVQLIAPLLARLSVEGRSLGLRMLDEVHRSSQRFVDDALRPLQADELGLAIGPPLARGDREHPRLRSTRLYRARLEAMVPADEDLPGGTISLDDLVHRRLLVPPRGVRSRELLEASIAASAATDDPGVATRIAREAYETNVLVLLGRRGLGTVVVPSDVARPFKHGHEFGGPGAEAFTWVPIHDGSRTLTHDVAAIHRTDAPPAVRTLVTHLKAVVADLDLDHT